jgi:energy-coupling factor transport system permease protein
MFLTYKDNDSPLHRLSPITKVVYVTAVLIALIVISHPIYLFAIFLSTIPIVVKARGLKEWYRFMRIFILLSFIIVFVNILVSPAGETVLLAGPYVLFFGELNITLEAIVFGISMVIRLLGMISIFAIFSLTMHPDDFFRMLSKRARRSGLAVSLTTRLYPTLALDAQNIMDAQRARGLELDKGNFIRKVKSRFPIILPLLLNSLERAIGIAESLESRGFGGAKKANYLKKEFAKKDMVLIGGYLVFLMIAIFFVLIGIGVYDYYPILGAPFAMGDVVPLFMIVGLSEAMLIA